LARGLGTRAGICNQPTPRPACGAADHGVERPVAATPSFSKDFHTFPRKFQAFPRKFLGFPNFSKDFQTFSLAVLRKIKGLSPCQAGIAFSPYFCVVAAATGGPGAVMPTALAIQHSANSDYRKEIVAISVRPIPAPPPQALGRIVPR
jgi:hypothetical protein